MSSTSPASLNPAGAGLADGGAGARRGRSWVYLPVVPFFIFVGIFLILPTVLVLGGAFLTVDGSLTLGNLQAVLGDPDSLVAFGRSIQLSFVSALVGAIIGGMFAWAVSAGGPGGRFRQISVAASGVLAQFGGVMLAFGFLATFGFNGMATILLKDIVGIDLNANPTWVYSMTGLIMVYTYFQIPLMVIVFLPALDGLRKEWQEASSSLGGSSWSFWRHVGGPILAPSFLGAVLLLFANAFSAYATAAALVSQGSPIITLLIGESLTSETVRGQENVGKALALGMVVVVVVVMSLYALLQRRASRWVR